MDIKQLINWSWQHKWWFVTSVALCLGIGLIYCFSTAPKYDVSAAIMLRTPDLESQQGEIMNLMGAESNKSAADEIEILTSHDLMEKIVDSLNLSMVVEKRRGLRWIPVYPCPDFALAYNQPVYRKKTYHMKEGEDKYRITIYPHFGTSDRMLGQLSVKRHTRESQIITLSMVSANPQQAVAILNLLLTLYNESANVDKYNVAYQSHIFLNERIATVQQELSDAENAVNTYKSQHQITNLTALAGEYHSLIRNYEHQFEDIDYDLRILGNIEAQLTDSLVCANKGLIYGSSTIDAVSALVQSFNNHVSQRFILMESATENNPKVQALDGLMTQQRANIARGCQEARAAIQLRKDHLSKLNNTYSTALAELPDIERIYGELVRTKKTKEDQLLFLIQKNEESNLILASSSVPVKVVNTVKQSADIVSPSTKKICAASLVFGMLLPLLVYLFGIFKKEYL